MEYKLVGGPYVNELYCDETGQIYHYLANGSKQYLEYHRSMRQVSASDYGKDTEYTSVKLVYVDGGYAPAMDVAELVARSAFGIGNSVYGYARLKRKEIKNLQLKNLEFISRDSYTGEITEITDNTGSTKLKAGGLVELDKQVYWDELPSAQAVIDYVDKVREGRKESILGERDRSVVAELLYTLITKKEMSAADALKILAIPGSYETLELFLEGKDIVEERVVNDMIRDREDQEREKKGSPVSVDTEPASNFRHPGPPPAGPRPNIDRRV